MNKLLIFPMAFMVVLAMFAMFYTTQSYYGSVDEKGSPIYQYGKSYNDLTPEEKALLNYSANQAQNGKISLQNLISIVAILALAITLAGAAGFNIFGSGLSVFTQKLIFNSVLFGGIWACLSINSYLVLFKDGVGIAAIIWIILTLMYVLGIGIQIDAGMAEA